MATLWVSEGHQKDFNRKIDAYTTKLRDIQAQYRGASTFTASYNSDSNISNCNIYLKKRIQTMQTAIDRASTLKTGANSYASSVISADRSLGGSIHKRAYSLYDQKGIGPKNDGVLAKVGYYISTKVEDFVHDAAGFAQDVIAGIKELYEAGKYIIDVALDIIKIAGVLVLFTAASLTSVIGVICLIGAVWALSKEVYNLVTDCLAAEAWMQGDLGKAEELSKRTLSSDLIAAGEWLDQKLGTNFFEGCTKVLLIGMEICQFTATMVCLYEIFRKSFNFDKQLNGYKPDGTPRLSKKNLNCTDLKNPSGRNFTESLRDWNLTKPFSKARLGSGTNWLKFAGNNLGFSLKMNASTPLELAGSFFENWEKNGSVINTYREEGWSAFGKLNPVMKETNKFSHNVAGIILE